MWHARNIGIDAASGEYIGFCDADDIPHFHMFERLINTALCTSADITVCAYTREDAQTNRVLSVEMARFGDAVFDTSTDLGIFPVINTSLWNKLFIAHLPKRVASLQEPSRVLTDMMMIVSMYPNCKTVAFISEPLYRYCIGAKSIIVNIYPNEIDRLFLCMQQIRTWIASQYIDKRFLDIYDLIVFIHLGLSVPLRLKCNSISEWRRNVRHVFFILDEQFPKYKVCQYASFSYTLNNKMRNAKVMLALWCKKLHIHLAALMIYRFLSRTLKVELKW